MIEGGEVLHMKKILKRKSLLLLSWPTTLSSSDTYRLSKARTFDQCAVYLPHLKEHPTLAIGTATTRREQNGRFQQCRSSFTQCTNKIMKELGYVKNTNTHMITLTILPEQEFLPDITKHLFMFLEIIQEKIPLGNF
jgi:hypothetical protein